MLRVLSTLLFGALCFIVGLGLGVWQSPRLKTTEPARMITSAVAKVPWLKATSKTDDDSPFEEYNYPTIKWRPKQLDDAPGAIVRLWTTFEPGNNPDTGTMKYKLTLFKASNRNVREVQLLDGMGFKLFQFNASDFHDIPGASDIVEARDSYACSEDQYKKAQDYSVK